MTHRDTRYASQYAQDAIVDRLLGGLTKGVFVDVGAHDGITLSNTYFFEKARGWTGVCFEPNPTVFEKLKANRSCTCENVGVGPEAGVLPYLKVNGYAEMLSGFVSQYDPRHLGRIEQEIRDYGGSTEQIDVPVLELNGYLIEHGLTEIDFCSIDVEGGELEILRSLDFERIHIRVLAVENAYWDQAMRRFMRKQGFALLRVAMTDDIYGRVGSVRGDRVRETLFRITGLLSAPGRMLERTVIG